MTDQLHEIQTESRVSRDRQRRTIADEYTRLLGLLADGVTLEKADRASMGSMMAAYQIDADGVRADVDWFIQRRQALEEIKGAKADLKAMRRPLEVGNRLKEIAVEIAEFTAPLLKEREQLEMESEHRLNLDDRIKDRRHFISQPRNNENDPKMVERTRNRTRDIIATGVFDE